MAMIKLDSRSKTTTDNYKKNLIAKKPYFHNNNLPS